MTQILKFTCAALLGLSLSACGGGASFEEDLLDQAEEFDALDQRVNAMTASGPRVVDNTRGSAKFSGGAAIVAGTEFDATLLIGDANLKVNFDGRTNISGSITNVGGVANANLYQSGTGTLDSYSGTVALSNGSVGFGNQLSVDYAGTLRGNGDTLVMDGTVDGRFLGNPNIRALEASGVDAGTLNGGRTVVGLEIVAERD